MEIVIKIIGIVFVLTGVLYFLNPDFLNKVMRFFSRGSRLYIAGIIRLALAVIFLLSARECDISWLIAAFGVLFLIGGILIFTLGLKKLKGIIEWYVEQSPLVFRFLSVIVMAFGAVIVYAA